jgi:hypothetical protein
VDTGEVRLADILSSELSVTHVITVFWVRPSSRLYIGQTGITYVKENFNFRGAGIYGFLISNIE